MMRRRIHLSLLGCLLVAGAAGAQATGGLKGTVKLAANGEAVHNATVLITKLGRYSHTEEDGRFEFRQVPPGRYEVVAHLSGAFTDTTRTVEVIAGQVASVDFTLSLAAMRQQVTVTASGQEQTVETSIQSVASLGALELAEKPAASLGDALDRQPGVAKRGFGPGPARPVVRGFDGDRVLILQDGMPTGSLSSQSGDHGETIDTSTVDRLEVVKGPATLLYGSNAIGGVVNAVNTRDEIHEHPHEGVRGFLTAFGGTANGHGGGSGGFEFGLKEWLFYGGGSGQRTGDYDSPIGAIANSSTRMRTSHGGFGYYGEQGFFNLGYNYSDGLYGVPFAAQLAEPDSEDRISLDTRTHNLRLSAGARHIDRFGVDRFRLTANYSDYQHTELDNGEPETLFRNKQFSYRGVFDQKRAGLFSGSFGFWGLSRNYRVTGDEALAPPVTQRAFAIFALEQVGNERATLQFGGRLEHNRYSPIGLERRSFTGFSGAVGGRVGLWPGGSLAANYQHAFRAPALEELYNHGPHPGNNTFEIGNSDLRSERSNGVDLSLRHSASRFRAEANFYYYALDRFVFLAPTGAVEEGFIEAEYAQADSRYTGGEVRADIGLHPSVWLNTSLDVVSAELASGRPLPRIPPLRGNIGLDVRYKGFSFRPHLQLSDAQDRLYFNETRTSGSVVFNVGASYTRAGQHMIHVFAVNAYNLNDRLYRNHLSFIKELAPEIGRGVAFSYTVRFF